MAWRREVTLGLPNPIAHFASYFTALELASQVYMGQPLWEATARLCCADHYSCELF